MIRTGKLLGATGAFALAAFGSSTAFAAGTTAGSSIVNTVSINYQVGGVDQSVISATDTLTVDRKVNLTVVELGSATTSVSPGQLATVAAFQITNASNTPLDFALATSQQVSGSGAHSNTDSFDATNVRIYVDTDNNGIFDTNDTLVAYIDELAADTSKTVFIVTDIPLGRVTGDVAAVTLTATGREGGGSGSLGAALTETTTANTSGMDTLFADGAGVADAARDGSFSAKDDFTVLAAALSIGKISRIVSDPFNGTTNPKMIPGATVEYCITVTNATGGASAASISVSDILPSTTTYDAGFGIKVNGTLAGATCNADGTNGGSFASGTVSATLPSVTAGDARSVLFRVTIN